MPYFLQTPSTNLALSMNQIHMYNLATRSAYPATQHMNLPFNGEVATNLEPMSLEALSMERARKNNEALLKASRMESRKRPLYSTVTALNTMPQKRGRFRKDNNVVSEDDVAQAALGNTQTAHTDKKENAFREVIQIVDDPNLPQALKNLKPLNIFSNCCKDAIMHRPEIKKAIVRSYELHNTMRTFETMLHDRRINNPEWGPNCSIPKEILTRNIRDLKCEYDAIMNISSECLTPWELKLRALVVYKINNGHCEVHTTTTDLGKWVARQRKRNKTSYSRAWDQDVFTFDKGILNKLQFIWKMIDDHNPWEYYYDQLKRYSQENNGSTKIPQLFPPNQRLANWVHNQRKRYERLISGEKPLKGQIHPYQIDLLNQIGFVWKIRFGRPKKSDARYRNKRYPAEKQKDDDDAVNLSEDAHPIDVVSSNNIMMDPNTLRAIHLGMSMPRMQS